MDTRTARKMVLVAALLGATALPVRALDRFVLLLEGEGGQVAVEIGSDGRRCAPRLHVYQDLWGARCEYGRPAARHHHRATIVRETTVVREVRVARPARRAGDRWGHEGWDYDRRDGERWNQDRPGRGFGGPGRGHGYGWKARAHKVKW